MSGTGQHLRRTLDLAGKPVGEKPLDGGPAFRRFEIALGRDRAVPADGQDAAFIVKWVCSAASHSSRISIRKWAFDIHRGSAGSKPLGPFSMA